MSGAAGVVWRRGRSRKERRNRRIHVGRFDMGEWIWYDGNWIVTYWVSLEEAFHHSCMSEAAGVVWEALSAWVCKKDMLVWEFNMSFTLFLASSFHYLA